MGQADEAELAARFALPIRLYGLRHLGSEDDANELAQEVLTIVIEALRAGRVEDLARLDHFVLGTSRNVVSGWRRGSERRRRLAATTWEQLDGRMEPPPATPDAGRLAGCVARLPQRDQTVIILTYCQEHEADEIGRRLGISAGNVRVIRCRALKAVRTCVEGGAG